VRLNSARRKYLGAKATWRKVQHRKRTRKKVPTVKIDRFRRSADFFNSTNKRDLKKKFEGVTSSWTSRKTALGKTRSESSKCKIVL
jgi:hypothetical protein